MLSEDNLVSADPNQSYQINSQIEELINAWRTEVNAPEILVYNEELVESIRTKLQEQQNLVDAEMDKNESDQFFSLTLYQMEIERVRFSLTKYLRTRILKIENSLEFILGNIDILERLSFKEKQFATKLSQLTNGHFEETVFKRLDEALRSEVEGASDLLQHATPELEEFVFCVAKEDLLDVDIGDGQRAHLLAGDANVLRYSVVRQFVLDGLVHLI